MRIQYTPSLPEYFWQRVDKSGGPDACWPWTMSCHRTEGYGNVCFKRRHDLAHRVAFQLTYGAILPGLFVCHRCDNPPCCNPAHLFVGTNKDNHQDALRKGRYPTGAASWPARNPDKLRGEKNPQAKLTEAAVLQIRADFEAGEHNRHTLARKYGVCVQMVCDIINRKRWTHI